MMIILEICKVIENLLIFDYIYLVIFKIYYVEIVSIIYIYIVS